MKPSTLKHRIFIATLCIVGIARQLSAQGTSFTYQGRLNEGGSGANGSYDLQFIIYDSTNVPGNIVAGPIVNSATMVTNGLFTVSLDPGVNAFSGGPRWLEIGVRTNGPGLFTRLAPRQQIFAAPYSITARNVTGSVAAEQLIGTIQPANIGAESITSVMLAPGSVVSNNLALGSIHSNHLTLGAIHSNHLALGSIHSNHLAVGSIHSNHLTLGAIHSNHLALGSIHSNHLAVGSIHSNHLALGAIHSNHLEVGCLRIRLVHEGIKLAGVFQNEQAIRTGQQGQIEGEKSGPESAAQRGRAQAGLATL